MSASFVRARRGAGLALLLAGLGLAHATTAGAVIRGSSFALPDPRVARGPLTGPRADGVLAQRAIDRSWGPSEDSSYVEVSIPGWRSEGLATGFSAVIPGLGQAYVGERRNGLFLGLLEIAGWTANRIYVHRAQSERDRSARFLGNPSDSASAWSFARWVRATGGDPSDLAAVWAHDPQAFYQTVLDDPAYLAGWKGQAASTRASFGSIRGLMRTNYRRATELSYALWLNHVLSALDALRAARLHNLPLQHNLELKLKSSWDRRGPELAAVLVRRF